MTSLPKRDPLSEFQPERRTFFFTVEEGEEGIEPIPLADWTTTDVAVEVCPAPPNSGRRRAAIVDQLSRLRGLSKQFWRSGVRRLDLRPWLRPFVSGSLLGAILVYRQLPRLQGLPNQFWRPGVRRLDLGAWLRPFVGGSLFGAILVYLVIDGPSVRLSRPSTPISAGAGSSTSTVLPKQPAVAEPLRSTVSVPTSIPEAASIVQPAVPAAARPQQRRVVPARPLKSNPSSRAGRAPPVAPVETAQFRGSMTIASTPPEARVFVNGRRVGVTPLELQQLPVGSRAVRVEADGYATWSSVVRVVADQQTNVTLTLAPQQGDSGR